MARRLRFGAGIAALAIVVLAPSVASARPSLPSSMASTGDSMTRAAGTGWIPWTDNPAGSWSTGTDTYVNSHYLRLLRLNPKIRGKNYNDARSGAKMDELDTQMAKAVTQGVGYITVEMGGNDICAADLGSMTQPDLYEDGFRKGLVTATNGLPKVKVFVASIPNIHQLWQIYHNDLAAQLAWATFGVCQSLLKNPTSFATADVTRRAAFQERLDVYNGILRDVCAEFRQCMFDDLAAFKGVVTTDDVVHTDYFHPSLSGQRKFAEGTWQAGYWP